VGAGRNSGEVEGWGEKKGAEGAGISISDIKEMERVAIQKRGKRAVEEAGCKCRRKKGVV